MPSLSFARDIRPLFREEDIEAMQDFANFDLSKYEDVRAEASNIYDRLSDGSMPCDEVWPDEQIDRFKQWMDGGFAP